MKSWTIDGIEVIADDDVDQEEAADAVREALEDFKAQRKILLRIEIRVRGDGQEVEVFRKEKSPIKRIRRITGYLSEDTNFNYAKKAELDSRVNHMGGL